MNNNLNFAQLIMLVKDFFQYKGHIFSISQDKQEINCVLYNSFIFKCGLEIPHNNFRGSIVLSNEYVETEFFGEKISLNNNREDIIKSLEVVDKYCQLRLPDKYLEEFFKNNNK